MKLWNKPLWQIEAEKREAIEQRERLRQLEEESGPKTPEALGAFYARTLPPDAPLDVTPADWTPAMSVDSWVDVREDPIYLHHQAGLGFTLTDKRPGDFEPSRYRAWMVMGLAIAAWVVFITGGIAAIALAGTVITEIVAAWP